MSVKTKGISVVATLAVALMGMYLVGKLPKRHTASVTAIWLPSPRFQDSVHITVTVGGSLKVDRDFHTAPYHEAWPIESGQRIEIRVRLLGTAPASTLGCAASIDELPIHTDAKEGPKHGDELSCWAVAP